jgi:hypothetical protein
VKRVVAVFPILMWGFFLIWLLLQFPAFVRLTDQGQSPIDFLAYQIAADAVQQGNSPYPALEASRRIWLSFHETERELLQANSRGAGQQVLREIAARPQQPGPYLYPPTLALLIAQLHIRALAFAAMILLAILGFAWLWLRVTDSYPAWLLLIIGSFDVLASLNGGNVELLLLFATLLAGWLLWRHHGLLAAPLITFVLLVKPFYTMFFIAFGLLHLVSHPEMTRINVKAYALALVATLALLAVEVYRWGAALQAATLDYLLHALEYQWFVLPLAEQTPMSAWNRTPLQALISAGVAVETAQSIALMLWLLFLGITVWLARRRQLTFTLLWALAFTLLYWGRPVGWGLNYLELVLLTTIWPTLHRWGKPLLLAAAVVLMGSHWWALVLTARGEGMPLLTLQRADLPWETWLVLPLSWLLVLLAAMRTPMHDPRPQASQVQTSGGQIQS